MILNVYIKRLANKKRGTNAVLMLATVCDAGPTINQQLFRGTHLKKIYALFVLLHISKPSKCDFFVVLNMSKFIFLCEKFLFLAKCA